MSVDDLDSLFAPEDEEGAAPAPGPEGDAPPWPVLVVDDDEEVHIMTRLVLGKLRYKDRPLELLLAHSAAEAEGIIQSRDDIAVALLDIVMETDDAGLRLARKIREEFKNSDVRIVLRTGQPGQAPVRDVIVNYDINDYKSKTELTSEKLFITIVTGLRSFDNIRSARAAESASRLKSSFLAAMSHEIRTPMNGVLGMLELLSHSKLDRDQSEMLNTARESAGTLLRIIDDILDFSKIEAGRMDMERQPLNFGQLVEGVAETLAPNARKKGVAFHIHVDPRIPFALLGDPVRLRQILFNLTGNAIKFTERGSVAVHVQQEEALPGRRRIRVEVRDTGIGIADDMKDQLFQPFTQAERSTSRRFGGTGLGLSISHRLIELMRGEIGLESELGRGSTFWFRLELEEAREGEAGGAEADVAGLRVLVGTEEAALRETLISYLEVAGATPVLQAAEPWDVALVAGLRDAPWPTPPGLRPAVLLADADSVRPLHMPPAVPQVGRPVRRGALYKAIATAAGRAQKAPAEPPANPCRPGRAAPPDVATAEAAGRLVLVAEDQKVNQMVISRQLAMLGLACEIFPDGLPALEAWRTGRYGLVLTDCNMPDMDGFELTKAIRADEAAKGLARTPVIALTANAMVGEEQRCLAAGMDGFLSKPVDLGQLNACMNRWLPAARPEAAPDAAPPPAAAEPPPVPAAEVLDLGMALDLFGEVNDEVREFFGEFLDAARPLLDAVENAFAADDAVQARKQAHALAGISKNAGAKELGALGDAVEQGLIRGDAAGARAAAAGLRAAFARAEAAVHAL
ncbi:MAG TPA: response regulator [Azospirillaceae bacterium]|nr:response regulator [Azospirillaceae bacterium]